MVSKRATLDDYEDVCKVVLEYDQRATRMSLLRAIPNNFFYINDKKTMVIIFMGVDDNKLIAHVYSHPEGRGKELKDFMVECGKKVLELTGCSSLINFVEIDNKPLQYFMRKLGATRVGLIEDGGGKGKDQIMYSSSWKNLGRL